MVVENLTRDRIFQPLATMNRCVVCLEDVPHKEALKERLTREQLKHANFWTQDHILSKLACRQHHSLFDNLRNKGDNLVALCRHDHRQIDRDKQRVYFEQGVPRTTSLYSPGISAFP